MTCSANRVSSSVVQRPAATSDVAWFRRIRAPRADQPSDWTISENITRKFLLSMTNDSTPTTETGSTDNAALIAAITDTTASTPENEAAAAAPVPVEEKKLSFDDLGLHADVKQALDDMGYFTHRRAVQHGSVSPRSPKAKTCSCNRARAPARPPHSACRSINRIIPAVRQPQAMILCADPRARTPGRSRAHAARQAPRRDHRGRSTAALRSASRSTALKRRCPHHRRYAGPRARSHRRAARSTARRFLRSCLDECDEMLSMGFLEDIERVTSNLPEKHQTLLFSATMPVEVERYAKPPHEDVLKTFRCRATRRRSRTFTTRITSSAASLA